MSVTPLRVMAFMDHGGASLVLYVSFMLCWGVSVKFTVERQQLIQCWFIRPKRIYLLRTKHRATNRTKTNFGSVLHKCVVLQLNEVICHSTPAFKGWHDTTVLNRCQ